MSSAQVLRADEIDTSMSAARELGLAVLSGLSGKPKRIASRFLYDQRGSDLFADIMRLQEYYPTKCEMEILERHADAIINHCADRGLNVVDLGAGDGSKTNVLLSRIATRDLQCKYVPIDISADALEKLTRATNQRFPGTPVEGLVAEYFAGLRWLSRFSDRRNLVLFLGSNIGNFNAAEARRFLRELWEALNPGDYLLIGFDLKKEIEVLLRAYNDAEGVTRDFNLNLLRRINRELGADFDLAKFRHYSTYDVFSGAMESYLVSTEQQTVSVDALYRNFEFEAWEPIHTEYSYKYLEADIEALACDTGFRREMSLFDSKRYFTTNLWKVDHKRES